MIGDIILEGFSIGSFNSSNEMVGIAILKKMEAGSEDTNGQKSNHPSGKKSEEMPQKFKKLEKFFMDLCTDFGKGDSFSTYEVETVLDIYIICTE